MIGAICTDLGFKLDSLVGWSVQHHPASVPGLTTRVARMYTATVLTRSTARLSLQCIKIFWENISLCLKFHST